MSFAKRFKEAHEEYKIVIASREKPSARRHAEEVKRQMAKFKTINFEPRVPEVKEFMIKYASGLYRFAFHFSCYQDRLHKTIQHLDSNEERVCFDFESTGIKPEKFDKSFVRMLLTETFNAENLFHIEVKDETYRSIIATLVAKS